MSKEQENKERNKEKEENEHICDDSNFAPQNPWFMIDLWFHLQPMVPPAALLCDVMGCAELQIPIRYFQ
jgi:hypothetical protein